MTTFTAQLNRGYAQNLVFSSDPTSVLVPVHKQLRKQNYSQEHVFLPNTRGRCQPFQRVNFWFTSFIVQKQNNWNTIQRWCYGVTACRVELQGLLLLCMYVCITQLKYFEQHMHIQILDFLPKCTTHIDRTRTREVPSAFALPMAKDALFVKKQIKDSKSSTASSSRRPSQANTTCPYSFLYKKKLKESPTCVIVIPCKMNKGSHYHIFWCVKSINYTVCRNRFD